MLKTGGKKDLKYLYTFYGSPPKWFCVTNTDQNTTSCKSREHLQIKNPSSVSKHTEITDWVHQLIGVYYSPEAVFCCVAQTHQHTHWHHRSSDSLREIFRSWWLMVMTLLYQRKQEVVESAASQIYHTYRLVWKCSNYRFDQNNFLLSWENIQWCVRPQSQF